MSLWIDSIAHLNEAVLRGVPLEQALASYYAGHTLPQFEAEYAECARTTARWEEARRPDQVPIQRTRLLAIDAELKKREEVSHG
jgi:hypothetical protein